MTEFQEGKFRETVESNHQDMEKALKYLESAMSVVQLMYREDGIEAVMADFLKETGEYLGVSHAGIYQLRPRKGQMELIAEWNAGTEAAQMEGSNGVEGLARILDVDERLVRKLDKQLVLSGRAVFPVLLHDAGGMYACFVEDREEKPWKPEKIRYMQEAVKILHAVVMRRIRKNSLASSYVTLENILDNIGCGIYVKDMETGRLVFANKYLKNTFSAELEEGILDEIFAVKEDAHAEGGSYEVCYESKGTWYDYYYTTITWVNGKEVRLCSIYDILDKKIYQRRIEQQAYTDFLTGLYNRMCCEKDMRAYIAETKKNGTKGALLYLDLDNFKSVNDNLGHQYGDMLLQGIADGMRSISGLSESCYRMGGDEFVIIIPPEHYERRAAIVEQMGTLFHTPFRLGDVAYHCTMSMGIVTFPDNGESVEELIKKADNTMYIAKKGGKDRIFEYSEEQ